MPGRGAQGARPAAERIEHWARVTRPDMARRKAVLKRTGTSERTEGVRGGAISSKGSPERSRKSSGRMNGLIRPTKRISSLTPSHRPQPVVVRVVVGDENP